MLKDFIINSTCALCGKLIFFSQNLVSVCTQKKRNYTFLKGTTQYSMFYMYMYINVPETWLVKNDLTLNCHGCVHLSRVHIRPRL